VIPKEWKDITPRLDLERTFGRRIVTKDVEGERYPFLRMVVPDGIQVVGFTNDLQVIMITETRTDIGETYSHLVGGTVDKDENVFQAADREFLEETGYKVGSLELLGTLHKDSAHLLGSTSVFLAQFCSKIQEPEEGISVELMGFEEAERALHRYITADSYQARGGGNSVIAFWLARQQLNI